MEIIADYPTKYDELGVLYMNMNPKSENYGWIIYHQYQGNKFTSIKVIAHSFTQLIKKLNKLALYTRDSFSILDELMD